MINLGRIIFLLLMTLESFAQDPSEKLKKAIAALSADPQMRAALIGFYVAERGSGKRVFEHQGNIGMVPASSLKVMTAAAAFDMLGRDFRYTTHFGYTGNVQNGRLTGRLVMEGEGDPTLGSTRFPQARQGVLQEALAAALQQAGIRQIDGGVVGWVPGFEKSTLPAGWIWEDIGNYYGAGHGPLNWHENQYDLWLKPGAREGDPVGIVKTDPQLAEETFDNELVSGQPGSGDQAYLFFRPGSSELSVRGSVPCCTGSYRIAGAVIDPVGFTLRHFQHMTGAGGTMQAIYRESEINRKEFMPLYAHRSPALDSILYWFLQKSINLYGEAMVHSISKVKTGKAIFKDGIRIMQDFWVSKGIDRRAVNIHDGSGLSPLNRVTPEALVKALLYAREQPWFPAYEKALPVHHGIRMKSGTMTGVRAYAGYLKNNKGKEYAFAILVNNFSGAGAAVNQHLFRVLDQLR